MEIKECKSSNIIIEEIKQKLVEIKDKFKPLYKKELCTYHDWWSEQVIGEKDIGKTTLFGRVIHEDISYKNLVEVGFSERILQITIKDPIMYEYTKEEFTKFAEENKDSIKSICFIRDFKE